MSTAPYGLRMSCTWTYSHHGGSRFEEDIALVSAIELAASALTLVSGARVRRYGDLARMQDMKGEEI
ncbi:hypothetical protein ACP4OV_007471 [Aristida adscensionis]